jgi:epoxyqueuosine reductase
MDISQQIKAKTLELGFDLVGITTAEPIDNAHQEYFQDWLKQGCAAGMQYLYRNMEKRFDPSKLLDGAKSVICVALNYKPMHQSLSDTHKFANYALYDDYHPFIKSRLHLLADFIVRLVANKSIHFKACVDSVPLAERALAQRAGLGFIGKNHCLTHPQLGGQLLLGELITTLELPPDKAIEENPCSNCDQCIKACPAGAFDVNGGFDSRKCISYLTIEEKEVITDPMASKINTLFGCNACLLACPCQMHAPACQNKDFAFFPQRYLLDPKTILSWTQDDFNLHFGNSAVARSGLERLKQNAILCLNNAIKRI